MRTRCILFVFIFSTLFMCFSAIEKANAKDQNLIFYMSFDGVSGNVVDDKSGNGNAGALKDDAKIVKEGKFGSALSVSGKGYLDCGNGESLNQQFIGLTIEVWLYPKELAGIKAPVAKWAYSAQDDHYGLFLSEDKALVAVADGATGEQGFTGSKPIEENKWNHIAVTWNSADNMHQIYINGKLDSSGPQTGKGINRKSQKSLTIGGQVAGPDPRFFNGLIDDVAIYSKVLTEEEIKRDMLGLADVQSFNKLLLTWAGIRTQY